MDSRKCSKVAIQGLGVSVVFWLFCLPAFSQLNYGRILGAITDQTGGVIAGATVTITDTDRGVTRTLVTDNAGEYNAPSLLPSTYSVKAEAKGFRTVDRQNVVIGVGQDVRVDLTLTPGEQTQTVTVTEAVPIVETTNAELGGTLQNQLFNELPVSGRLYTKLLEFVPGVSSRPGGSTPNFSSNGSVGSAQDWMIDGVSALNIFDSGGPLVGVNSGVDNLGILPLDAIQEVNVIEIPRAEYGWVPGAQINVGLKSGTNNFHGSADALGRDTALDARNPFLGSTLPKGIDQLEQFGASIGGPIKKDKLFFFGAYEGERFAIGSASVVTIPTTASLGGDTSNSLPDAIADINAQIAAGKAPGTSLSPLSLALAGCPSAAALAGVTNAAAIHCLTSNGVFGNTQTAAQGGGNVTQNFLNTGRSNDGIVKFDYHLNDHNSLNGEYYFARANSDTPDGIQSYWEDFNSNRVDLLRGAWVWTPNSSWVNEARFGWDLNHNLNAMAECEQPNGSSNTAAPPNYQALFGLVSGAPGSPPEDCGFPLVAITNSATLGAAAGSGEPSATYDFVNNTSYTRGKHIFKFGGEFHHDHFSGTSHVTSITGAVNFGAGGINAFSTASGLEDFLTGVNSGGAILLGNPVVTFGEERYALFGEDDYRVNRKVLVNVGLRWEWRPAIAAQNNDFGTFDPTSPTGLRQQTNGQPLFHTSWANFGPRVGIAWDVTGNGKTVVRAGGSIVDETLVAVTLYVSMDKTPTGFTLYQSNGTATTTPGGNINFGTATLLPGQINWAQNTPIFNTTSSALVCANGATNVPVGGVANFPSPCALNVENPTLNPSYVSSWNVSIEHAFTNSLALTVAYVGNHLTDGLAQLDVNQPALGAPNGKGAAGTAATILEQTRRPYYSQFPYLGQILQTGNNNSSNYNSVQASLTQRVARGLSFSAKYAYQHSLTINDGTITTWGKVMNSNDPQLDYGNNGFIPFQDFGFTATYAIPAIKSPAQLLEGWELNTTVTSQSVKPFNAADTSSDLSGTGEALDRWTLVGTPHDFAPLGALSTVPCFGAAGSRFAGAAGCQTGLPQACVNAANGEAVNAALNAASPGSSSGLASLMKFGCYMEGNSVIVPPAQGTYGTMSRNELVSVPFREWDLSINKLWKVKERYSAQFRAEFFNILNSREYASGSSSGGVFTNISNPATFGTARATPNNSNPVNGTGGPREIQLGLVLRF